VDELVWELGHMRAETRTQNGAVDELVWELGHMRAETRTRTERWTSQTRRATWGSISGSYARIAANASSGSSVSTSSSR
jgi:hypothetical protein